MLTKLNQALMLMAMIFAWAVVTLWAPASPLKIALSAGFLLTLPGYIVYRLILKEDHLSSFWSGLAYSVAFSSLYLMLLGLAMSVILPLFGIARPLTEGPLVAAIVASLGALAGVALHRQKSLAPSRFNLPQGFYSWLMVAYGAMLPLLAIAGAFRLNNGGSDRLTLVMFGLVSLYLLALIWPKRRQVQRVYSYALFMMSAALLFATSMRGWFITGHDIIQEYQVFQLTSQHGVWSMSFLQNAYTACLSITILPTILARLTGLSDPYIYKLLFQLIFALMAPVLYLTVSRFLPRRAALLSAFIFMSFPTFLTDMPMLCRQEMGFLFFALVFATLFDTRLVRRTKSSLVLLLGLGMILSHYSTSYAAMGIILTAKLIELAVVRWGRWRRHKSTGRLISMPLSWPVTIALLLTVYLWNSQITNTSQGITNTITGIATSLPQLLNNTTETGVAAYSLVGHTLSNGQLFAQYASTVTQARDFQAKMYYPTSLTNNFPLQQASQVVAPATRVGQWLSQWHVPLYNLYDEIRSDYAKLIQVLLLLGLAVLAFRAQLARVPRQFLFLGIASVAMIALEVLLPNVINYGLLRLIQQCLVFLAPAIVLACYFLLGALRLAPHWRVRVTAIIFAGFFLVNAGLLPALTGGYAPNLTTSNSGFYYEAYYTHADELAGFSWLSATAPKGSVVNADDFARRKMITYTGIYARASLAPTNIAEEAYVYLSYGDTTFNHVPLYYDGQLIYEQTPNDFLNNTKNLVYSNGAVRIYK